MSDLPRYFLQKTVTRVAHATADAMRHDDIVVNPTMVPHPSGDWVRFEDVEQIVRESTRQALHDNSIESRLGRLEAAAVRLGALADGRCPECGEAVRDYKAPVGWFAPEAFATLRERGIDPSSGHRRGCSYKKGAPP